MKKNATHYIILTISIAVSVGISRMILGGYAQSQKSNYPTYLANLDWEGKAFNDIPEEHNQSCEKTLKGTDKTYRVQINSQGFRDYEYPLDKDPRHLRIAVIGDSTTFGAGVNLENTYVKQLEQILRQYASCPIEVLNFGACGAGTINELELLEKKGLAYKPDIILLQMDPNDAYVIAEIKQIDPLLDGAILFLAKNNSEIGRMLKYKLKKHKFNKYKRTLSNRDLIDNIVVPLQSIIDICHKKNIRLAIVNYAAPYHPSYYANVISFIQTKKIPFLDLQTDESYDVPYEKKYLDPRIDERTGYPFDPHPTPYANALIAQLIKNFLLQEHIITPSFLRKRYEKS